MKSGLYTTSYGNLYDVAINILFSLLPERLRIHVHCVRESRMAFGGYVKSVIIRCVKSVFTLGTCSSFTFFTSRGVHARRICYVPCENQCVSVDRILYDVVWTYVRRRHHHPLTRVESDSPRACSLCKERGHICWTCEECDHTLCEPCFYIRYL